MTHANEQSVRNEKGGETFTTFFFVALGACVVAAFVSGTALSPRDTLLRFVPADAVAYVHANNEEASRLYAATTGRNVYVREAAVYVTVRNDVTAWTTLSSNDSNVRVASSLVENQTVRHALAAMRRSSALQAYAVPSALFRPILGSAASATMPFVAGVSTHENGVIAMIVTAEEASRHATLGIKAYAPALYGSRAQLTQHSPFGIFGNNSDISTFDILFPTKSGEHTFAKGMADAEARLRARFAISPVAISFLAAPDAGVILHLPSTHADDIRKLIEDYVTAAWPTRRTILLPDQVQSHEILVDPESSRFRPNGAGFSMLAVIDGPHIALKEDGRGGTIIVAGADLLPEKIDFTSNTTSNCPPTGGRSYIHMLDSATFMSELPFGNAISDYFQSKYLLIQKYGDKLVLFCGYEGDTVDKVRKN